MSTTRQMSATGVYFNTHLTLLNAVFGPLAPKNRLMSNTFGGASLCATCQEWSKKKSITEQLTHDHPSLMRRNRASFRRFLWSYRVSTSDDRSFLRTTLRAVKRKASRRLQVYLCHGRDCRALIWNDKRREQALSADTHDDDIRTWPGGSGAVLSYIPRWGGECEIGREKDQPEGARKEGEGCKEQGKAAADECTVAEDDRKKETAPHQASYSHSTNVRKDFCNFYFGHYYYN